MIRADVSAQTRHAGQPHALKERPVPGLQAVDLADTGRGPALFQQGEQGLQRRGLSHGGSPGKQIDMARHGNSSSY